MPKSCFQPAAPRSLPTTRSASQAAPIVGGVDAPPAKDRRAAGTTTPVRLLG